MRLRKIGSFRLACFSASLSPGCHLLSGFISVPSASVETARLAPFVPIHPDSQQDRILGSLEEVFEEVKTKGGVHEADMPDVEVGKCTPRNTI